MKQKDEYQIPPITGEERYILIAGMGKIADVYMSIANKEMYQEKREIWLELNDKIVGAVKTKGE